MSGSDQCLLNQLQQSVMLIFWGFGDEEVLFIDALLVLFIDVHQILLALPNSRQSAGNQMVF